MSRILRRPLFRGGPVSSYGTGIASGLADGGRVNLDIGGFLPNAGPLPFKLGSELGQFKKVAPFGKIIEEKEEETTDILPEGLGEKLINTTDEYIPKVIGRDPTPKLVKNPDYEPPTKTVRRKNRIGEIVTTQVELDDDEIAERKDAEVRAEGYLPNVGPAPMKGVTQINNTPLVVNQETAEVIEPEESTTINEAEIRERAELFNKMLSEGFEKEKKSAQISDASDYALQFFKSTVGEGKGIKEAAGDVAGRALATPSRTEKVQEGKKKTKQTATVMAINDYLAGEKSERELKKILATADYKGNINLKNSLALIEKKRKDVGTRISEAAAKSGIGGVATVTTIENVLRPEGKKITKIPKDQTGKWTPDKEDEGSYIIEEETKNVFEIISGVPVKIY